MTIKACFALGDLGQFGFKGGLPWGVPLKGDMKHFREFTKDCVVVMGRKTFESLPFKLPNRINIVLASDDTAVAKNGDSADGYATSTYHTKQLPLWLRKVSEWYNQPVCVIGGCKLVREVLEFADETMYTSINRTDGEWMPADVIMDLLPKYLGNLQKIDGGQEGDFQWNTKWFKK